MFIIIWIAIYKELAIERSATRSREKNESIVMELLPYFLKYKQRALSNNMIHLMAF
jgi:hypothetical protein